MRKILVVLLTCLVLFGCDNKKENIITDEKHEEIKERLQKRITEEDFQKHLDFVKTEQLHMRRRLPGTVKH